MSELGCHPQDVKCYMCNETLSEIDAIKHHEQYFCSMYCRADFIDEQEQMSEFWWHH